MDQENRKYCHGNYESCPYKGDCKNIEDGSPCSHYYSDGRIQTTAGFIDPKGDAAERIGERE